MESYKIPPWKRHLRREEVLLGCCNGYVSSPHDIATGKIARSMLQWIYFMWTAEKDRRIDKSEKRKETRSSRIHQDIGQRRHEGLQTGQVVDGLIDPHGALRGRSGACLHFRRPKARGVSQTAGSVFGTGTSTSSATRLASSE
ncbi:hypothetical protein PABG_11962 [Paracoccidioides brasiliensis Pb03]|nr:hypothetical protein PABG_11962 [Paracoccidioides brasiliensis Pb03]